MARPARGARRHIANVGVHGNPVSLHLESLWIKNITITTGLVDTYSTAKLLQMLAEGQIDTQPLSPIIWDWTT